MEQVRLGQVCQPAPKADKVLDKLHQASKKSLRMSNQDLYESVGYAQRENDGQGLRATAKTQFKAATPGQSYGITSTRFKDGGRLPERISPSSREEASKVHIAVSLNEQSD